MGVLCAFCWLLVVVWWRRAGSGLRGQCVIHNIIINTSTINQNQKSKSKNFVKCHTKAHETRDRDTETRAGATASRIPAPAPPPPLRGRMSHHTPHEQLAAEGDHCMWQVACGWRCGDCAESGDTSFCMIFITYNSHHKSERMAEESPRRPRRRRVARRPSVASREKDPAAAGIIGGSSPLSNESKKRYRPSS